MNKGSIQQQNERVDCMPHILAAIFNTAQTKPNTQRSISQTFKHHQSLLRNVPDVLFSVFGYVYSTIGYDNCSCSHDGCYDDWYKTRGKRHQCSHSTIETKVPGEVET